MSLATVYSSLVDALNLVQGLRVAEVPAPGTPPGRGLAVLLPESVEFDASMGRGFDNLIFALWVYVAQSSPRTQIDELAKLITDIKATLESLTSNGGLPAVRVRVASSFDGYAMSDTQLFGCRLLVDVGSAV